jgi:hypothetical protein
MMLMPVALNIATPEQVEGVRHMFKYFEEHPRGWLEWPSFMYPFSEAAYNAGKAKLLSNVLYATAQRVYKRICTPKLSGVGKRDVGLPEEYNYRIPGVACEFWPIELEDKFLAGSENYGWGATLPMFIIRYIIGYRELENPEENAFILSPAIPDEMLKQNGIVGMRNLQFREKRFDVEYMIEAGDVKLAVVKIDGKEAKYEVQNFQKIKIEMKK